VKLLLEKGANPKQGDDNERTALHWAVEEQGMRVAELLIKKAGDIVHAADQEKRTALHCAASIGNTHIVEMLLDHGARINVQDRNGQTPLHLGISQQHEGVVACLVWRGADWSVLNKKKRTPIHLATDLENEAIIEAIRSFRLAAGANDADDYENTSHKEATKPKNRNAKFAARVEDE
jgi:ankyrin repeat protein